MRQSVFGGFGLYPSPASPLLDRSDVRSRPVLLPYFGVETAVKDDHSHRSLIKVLQGSFACVTVGELQAQQGTGQTWVADGLFAVKQGAVPSDKTPLPPSTLILDVAFDKHDTASCYMLHHRFADGVTSWIFAMGSRTCLIH